MGPNIHTAAGPILSAHWCNAGCRTRAWRVLVLQAVQAVLFVLLIWLVQKALEMSNKAYQGLQPDRSPEAVPIGALPDCRRNIFLQVRLAVWGRE